MARPPRYPSSPRTWALPRLPSEPPSWPLRWRRPRRPRPGFQFASCSRRRRSRAAAAAPLRSRVSGPPPGASRCKAAPLLIHTPCMFSLARRSRPALPRATPGRAARSARFAARRTRRASPSPPTRRPAPRLLRRSTFCPPRRRREGVCRARRSAPSPARGRFRLRRRQRASARWPTHARPAGFMHVPAHPPRFQGKQGGILQPLPTSSDFPGA